MTPSRERRIALAVALALGALAYWAFASPTTLPLTKSLWSWCLFAPGFFGVVLVGGPHNASREAMIAGWVVATGAAWGLVTWLALLAWRRFPRRE